jgi:hypothetical protein
MLLSISIHSLKKRPRTETSKIESEAKCVWLSRSLPVAGVQPSLSNPYLVTPTIFMDEITAGVWSKCGESAVFGFFFKNVSGISIK